MNRLALTLLALTAVASVAQEKKESVVMRSIRNCARIETETGSGTGWVVDADRRVLVTNYHVVANSLSPHTRPGYRHERVPQIHNTVNAVFPAYREDGSLISEKRYYERNVEKLTQAGRVVRGVVIDADEARDLAVIVVDKLPPGVKAFPLAAASQDPGDEHFQIGCPGLSDFYWVYGSAKVRSRGFQMWTVGEQQMACQMLNTDSPCYPGDSGGPVINKDGEIVGVTQGWKRDPVAVRALSYAVDLSELKAYLKEVDEYLTPGKTADDFLKRGRFYLRRGRPLKATQEFNTAVLLRGSAKQPMWEPQLEFCVAVRALHEIMYALRAAPGFVNDPALDADLAGNLVLAQAMCREAMKEADCPPGRAEAELAALRLAALPAEAFIPVELKGARWKPVLDGGKDDPEYQKALADARAKHAETWGPKIKAVADGVEAAIKADPKVALAYQTRARLDSWNVKPDWGKIIADRTAAVKLLNTVLARNARSYLDRAEAYAGAKEFAKAAADCDAALKINPRSAVAHSSKANYLLAAGDPNGALAVAARLVDPFDEGDQTYPPVEPTNPHNWELLANIVYELKDFKNQARFLTKCLALYEGQQRPLPRRLFADRGDAYAAQKMVKEAIDDYGKAMILPDFLGDKKPESALEQLYQSLYGIPAIQAKIAALKK